MGRPVNPQGQPIGRMATLDDNSTLDPYIKQIAEQGSKTPNQPTIPFRLENPLASPTSHLPKSPQQVCRVR